MTKIIGLTGKSGSGKGAVCEIFARHGIPSVNTDAVYHDILANGGDCTNELVAAFGKQILDGDGRVCTKKLASTVFGHKNTEELLHTLNAITHKYIMAKTRDLVRNFANEGAPAVLIDAPQLFEAGVERECDLVLGVIASPTLCVERITSRDGIDEIAALRRLAAQHDDAYFKAHCDAVIENTDDLATLERAVCQFIEQYGVNA